MFFLSISMKPYLSYFLYSSFDCPGFTSLTNSPQSDTEPKILYVLWPWSLMGSVRANDQGAWSVYGVTVIQVRYRSFPIPCCQRPIYIRAPRGDKCSTRVPQKCSTPESVSSVELQKIHFHPPLSALLQVVSEKNNSNPVFPFKFVYRLLTMIFQKGSERLFLEILVIKNV
jgi:hypothetical protein